MQCKIFNFFYFFAPPNRGEREKGRKGEREKAEGRKQTDN
jgi:hypothetical protein